MSLRVRAVPVEHLPWICAKAQIPLTSDMVALGAYRDDGAIEGMIAFNEWTKVACGIHFAFDSIGSVRLLVPAAYTFAFKSAGRKMLIASTAEVPEKKAAFRWAKRFGFKEWYRLAGAWDDGIDVVVSRLVPADIRLEGWV